MQSWGAGHAKVYVAVVDDDESLCRSLNRLLRTAGFQTVAYASAEDLLEDSKRPRFDCLVLDIQLKGMSGLELCQRLAAVRNTTPIIFITADDDPEIRARALAAGCAGYFRKTDPGDQLLGAIRLPVDETSTAGPDSAHHSTDTN